MYTLNGWWFLSSGGSYPPVFTVEACLGIELRRQTSFIFVENANSPSTFPEQMSQPGLRENPEARSGSTLLGVGTWDLTLDTNSRRRKSTNQP